MSSYDVVDNTFRVKHGHYHRENMERLMGFIHETVVIRSHF